jgi:cell division protein FtsQ
LFFGINEIVSIGQEEIEKFSAENIEITGNEILNREKVIELCNISETTEKVENINIDEIASSLMESAFIKGVSITRRLPRTLNITIEERKPVAFIYGKGLNLIDSEGYLIPIPNVNISWDLPLISGIEERLGNLGEQTISDQAQMATSLLNHLRMNDIILTGLISEISFSNDKFLEIILIKGGAKIKINRDNYAKELYILQNYVTNYLNWSDLTKIDYIDLRFQDQLIVKKKA